MTNAHIEPAYLDAEYDPPDCPAWARERTPDRLVRFQGKRGLPAPWCSRPGPLGERVAGVDRWQANHFIVHRPETADELYSTYTPLDAAYERGTLPACERVVTAMPPTNSATACAMALLTGPLAELLPHPESPPLGPACAADRGLADDDALLATGCGFCNEQARLFIRFCQIAGLPARMIYLFYSDGQTGHTIAEFHADGRWAMADVSTFTVFPGEDGRLLSAAEAHDPAHADAVARTYADHRDRLLSWSDEALVGGQFKHVADARERRSLIAERAAVHRQRLEANTFSRLSKRLGSFGVLNYPLPSR